ncbi:hypothetical protein [Malaciobacter marinus]|jgi:hypothetical protein|uniref:Uncharacterized protein n=1 Tax=Malaciobacter marinus TaxID=505249 RepID=A0A347TJ87_9BACT|nr:MULTISPECIES: hypothetical protein [Malaciobacter]AXX86665.1 hypothetical protein AMRN_0913 [Malaciobacter marinus]PHO12880.1 hypothetical protein CPG38_05145 [Malaciobacter marinus]PHO14709.1 hypothetical protein CPH92_10560 [Malaciobacter marinus]PPK62022.1 hypothetical protein B0F89_106116 [Malaciobacter marinus]RYA23875.1 hypothetical protein CRU96_05565 [Malaciobacter halophilus]
MKYEELIKELCDVIKESEIHACKIYEDFEFLQESIENMDLSIREKEKLDDKISNSLGLLQHQDLHRQRIERVVNFVCEKNNIDKSQYNLADSAKNIDNSEDNMSEEDLEALIKQMQG